MSEEYQRVKVISSEDIGGFYDDDNDDDGSIHECC